MRSIGFEGKEKEEEGGGIGCRVMIWKPSVWTEYSMVDGYGRKRSLSESILCSYLACGGVRSFQLSTGVISHAACISAVVIESFLVFFLVFSFFLWSFAVCWIITKGSLLQKNARNTMNKEVVGADAK